MSIGDPSGNQIHSVALTLDGLTPLGSPTNPLRVAFDPISLASHGVSRETGSVETTGATTETVWSRLLADGEVLDVRARVACRRTDVGGDARGSFAREALSFRAGGSATLQGDVVVPAPDRKSVAAHLCSLEVNGNNVRLRVTGAAGQTVLWHACVDLVSVTT